MALDLDNLPFRMLTPSHGRPKMLLTNPLLPWVDLILNDSEQEDAYERTFEAAGVRPRSISLCGALPSIAAVRQWMNDNLDRPEDPFLMHIDDDFKGMKPMMRFDSVDIKDPHDIVAIFWESYISASDAGAGIFGWAHKPSPQHRAVWTPIGLRGWLRGIWGLIDREVRFDRRFYVMEDVDICLAQQVPHRIIWQDYRWGPMTSSWDYAGIAHTRTDERRRAAVQLINDKYGNGTCVWGQGGNDKKFRLYI